MLAIIPVDNPGDRKIIGNDAARYQFGISLGASYKGWSLEVLLQGVGKRDYWLGGPAMFPFGGAGAGDAVFQSTLCEPNRLLES